MSVTERPTIMSVRAWGEGLRGLILQFIKGGWKYGELKAIEALRAAEPHIEVRQCGLGFTQRDKSDMDKHIKAAHEALKEAEAEITSGNWDLVILDEINYAVKFGLLEEQEIVELLKKKPAGLHVVLTGRDARPDIIEQADLVTEMKLIRHPFQKGIKAQKGIEF